MAGSEWGGVWASTRARPPTFGSHLNASGECGWSLVDEVCLGPGGESARHDGRDGDDPERHPAAARANERDQCWRESAVAMPAQGCTGWSMVC